MIMCKKNVFLALGLAAVVGLHCSALQAETITYLYDFENLGLSTPTLLASDVTNNPPNPGVDNWRIRAGQSSPVANTYGTANATADDYAYNAYSSTVTKATNLWRPNDTNWSFSLVNDQYFEFSVEINTGKSSTNGKWQNQAGLTKNDQAGIHIFQVGSMGGSAPNYNWRVYDQIEGVTNNNYTFNTAYPSADTFAIVGAEVTPVVGSPGYYNYKPYTNTDLTDQKSNRTYYGVSSETTLYFPDLSTMYNGLVLVQYARYSGTARMDDIKLAQTIVPEPGTFALLAAGLVGLLAYAWRKRR
jgi:hypothetical protein